MTFDTPDCRMCGTKENMQIKNYSELKNKVWWYCHGCGIETEVILKC